MVPPANHGSLKKQKSYQTQANLQELQPQPTPQQQPLQPQQQLQHMQSTQQQQQPSTQVQPQQQPQQPPSQKHLVIPQQVSLSESTTYCTAGENLSESSTQTSLIENTILNTMTDACHHSEGIVCEKRNKIST